MRRTFVALLIRGLMIVTGVCASACSSPTQLIVSIETSLVAPTELDEIEVFVTGPSSMTVSTSDAVTAETPFPQTLTVVPTSGALGPVHVRVVGLLDGATVVEQEADVTLEAGRSITLRIFLSADCAGVECGQQTCLCGRCTDLSASEWLGRPATGDPCLSAAMDAGTLDAALDGSLDAAVDGAVDAGPPLACERDSECGDGLDCTDDRCESGECAHVPNDALCVDGTMGMCLEGFGCQYDGCSPSTCVAPSSTCQVARCDGDSCVIESACEVGEQCCAGSCVPLGCDDGEVCTDDSCGAAGCENVPNVAACNDGVFCNGADSCAGGACTDHAGDPCSGASVCDEGAAMCLGCSTDADCPDDEVGAWSACDYGGQCDEAATRTRPHTSYSCVATVCQPDVTVQSEACTRSTEDDMCGATTFGTWSSCGGFGDVCDESGTRTRPRTDRACRSGACSDIVTSDAGTCNRSSTDGDVCGAGTTYGTFGACDYSGTCDENASRSRTRTDFTCSAETCNGADSTDTDACTRDTDGTSCGSTMTGMWGACDYSGTCDEAANRSRMITMYTCVASSCDTDVTSESEACTRDTDGMACGSPTTGPWGACMDPDMDCNGEQSRDLTDPTCELGVCDPNTVTQSTWCAADEGNFCSARCGMMLCLGACDADGNCEPE